MKKLVFILVGICFVQQIFSQASTQSLVFDGVDDYVNMGDPANNSLDFGMTASFTVSAWIKTTATPTSYLDIVSKRRIISGTHYEGYMMALNSSGKIYFVIEDVNGLFTQMNGNLTVNDGNWHYVTGVRNCTTDQVSIYVDGVLDVSFTDNTTASLATTATFWIGQWPYYGRYFAGNIDDVSMWSAALTPSQIDALMDCPPTGTEPNLISFWNFEEGSGILSNDLSSFANSGTLMNGTNWSGIFPSYICSPPPSCEVLSQYLFSGNTLDSINTNHGTNFGATLTVDRFSSPNSAFQFHGAEYIELGSDFDLPTRSVNVWFKASQFTSTPAHIYDSDHAGLLNASTKMWVWTQSGQPSIGMSTGSGSTNQHNEPINPNQWYMATIVVSTTDVRFFLDANQIAQFSINPGNSTTGNTFAILGASRLIDRFFEGEIDDISIFDCALSTSQIDSLFANYTPPAPANCLVAEYEFTGNTNDNSGNMLNATNNGATLTSDRFGNLNNAYHFSSGDYMQLGDDFDFSQRSINIWFKAEQFSASPKHIYDSDHPGMLNASTKMWVWMHSGQPKLGISTGSGSVNQHNEPINPNQWYMATIVVGSSDVRFYLDGNQIAQFGLHTGCSTTGNSLALIGASRLIDRFFEGDIDDVTIYDCALGVNQIDSLFNNFVPSSTVSCVGAEYYFNGNADDATINGLNGTAVNTVLTTDLFGNPNSAFEFNGTDAYIDLMYGFDFASRTINLWFKADNIDTVVQHLYDSDSPLLTNGSTKMWVVKDSTQRKIGFSTGSGGINEHFELVNNNQWYMATLVAGPTQVQYYLNGQSVYTGSFNSGNSTSGYDYALIGTSRLFDRYFDGIIDNVTIYQCEMSPSFIDSLFQLGSAVLQPAFCDLEATIQTSNPDCYGAMNGSAITNVINNIGPVSYVWSDNSFNPNLSNLPSGNYYVIISDTTGCDTTINFSILDPDPIGITYTTINPQCNASDGSIEISVSNGTGPYQITWSSGDTTLITDSLSAGLYHVEVMDATGCLTSQTVSLNNANGMNFSDTIIYNTICTYGNTGGIDVTLTGGSFPLSFDWSNGAITEDINNLSAGNYELIVTDANGCILSGLFVVSSPSPFDYSFTIQPSFCNSSNGVATVNVTGGSSPYVYNWSNGANTASVNGLAVGYYSVTVTDNNGCFFTDIAIINEYGGPQIAVDTIIQPGCSNNNGAVEISIYAGVPPFTYYWSDNSTSQDLINVGFGTYFVLVTGSNGCSSIGYYDLQGQLPDSIEICIISVDSLTQRNLIIWEKPFTTDIDYFNVYKETSAANVYNLVGSVDYDSLSIFLDSTANPQVRGWRYKLTAVDFCGNESMQSQFHKTLHLNANIGVGGVINLDWDEYSGFNYSTFYIWRYHPSTDWMIIDSIPSNLFSYTDINGPNGNLDYYIEVRKSSGCNPSRASEVSSRSNTRTQIINSVSEFDPNHQYLTIFPNPVNDQLFFDLEVTSNMYIEILDAQGKLVMGEKLIRNNIETNFFSRGIYNVRITTESNTFIGRFIKY